MQTLAELATASGKTRNQVYYFIVKNGWVAKAKAVGASMIFTPAQGRAILKGLAKVKVRQRHYGVSAPPAAPLDHSSQPESGK